MTDEEWRKRFHDVRDDMQALVNRVGLMEQRQAYHAEQMQRFATKEAMEGKLDLMATNLQFLTEHVRELRTVGKWILGIVGGAVIMALLKLVIA